MGKRSIPWHEDIDILVRLASVSLMVLQGAKAWQIAETMGYSLRTAHRDIDRCYTIWKEEARKDVDDNRRRSIAQFREIQTQAWERYRATKHASWLKLAMETEEKITQLEGTTKQLGSSPDNPIHVKTIEVVKDYGSPNGSSE